MKPGHLAMTGPSDSPTVARPDKASPRRRRARLERRIAYWSKVAGDAAARLTEAKAELAAMELEPEPAPEPAP